jgi:hypothetical protein
MIPATGNNRNSTGTGWKEVEKSLGPAGNRRKMTSVKLAADSTFFSEHSHINLCLSNLSVSYRTRRALSSDAIRFSIGQSMAQRISKYCIFLMKFWQYIRVKAAHIHCVNSENTCVRCNSMSSIQRYTQIFDSSKIAQSMSFD